MTKLEQLPCCFHEHASARCSHYQHIRTVLSLGLDRFQIRFNHLQKRYMRRRKETVAVKPGLTEQEAMDLLNVQFSDTAESADVDSCESMQEFRETHSGLDMISEKDMPEGAESKDDDEDLSDLNPGELGKKFITQKELSDENSQLDENAVVSEDKRESAEVAESEKDVTKTKTPANNDQEPKNQDSAEATTSNVDENQSSDAANEPETGKRRNLH